MQPFLSGAISKTVNMPETASIEEVEEIYFEGWKTGLKALAIYRDNCKVGQPLSDGKPTRSRHRPMSLSNTGRSASACRRCGRARRSRSAWVVPRAI